jgi:hypothetical protein
MPAALGPEVAHVLRAGTKQDQPRTMSLQPSGFVLTAIWLVNHVIFRYS